MKSIRRWLHCRNQQERLSLYLDGQLSSEEAARLEKHLAECETCAEQLATLCRTVELLRSVPSPRMPRPVVIPESLIAAQRQTRRLDSAFYALRTSVVAVSAALVLTLSWNAFAFFGRSDSTMVEYALEEPASAAMMASAPEAEALEEAEREVSSKARALAAGSEPAEEIDAAEAEMVAEAAAPSQREAAPQQEDATVAAAEAPPTDDQQGVSAMALPEESDVEPAKSEESSADDEAGPGDVSESADSVAPSLLDREEPRDAQSGSALETDVPAVAEELLLGGGAGESPGQSGERVTWTIPRILATGFASLLVVLLGALVWVGQRRVRH